MNTSEHTTPATIVATGATYISTNPLAMGLVRVGEAGINPGDNNVLDAYFSKDYVFHGPGGDLNLTQLKAFWTDLRNALTGFAITRLQIIVEGNMAAGRNVFSGTFDNAFKNSPVGTIQPTGKPVSYEVINTFRYDEAGLLAEEWVQYDNVVFLKQFGVNLLDS